MPKDKYMDHIQAKNYLLSKPFTLETFPFGEGVAVFKVKDKMFATLALGKMGKSQDKNKPIWWMNLKCDPQEAIMLRDIFTAVIPGYHMNKVHWNTLKLDGSIPSGEVERMMDNSFDLVVSKMTKKDQASILVHL
jgi:predicted DNA-binding protein (MmcQ/YjbR family)